MIWVGQILASYMELRSIPDTAAAEHTVWAPVAEPNYRPTCNLRRSVWGDVLQLWVSDDGASKKWVAIPLYNKKRDG